ncbi:MAG TPA: uroporphyrinogen decarboxylase family protein [bacterium]|nr:uroporphyrinogen decarboxylase family protein [bacterium]
MSTETMSGRERIMAALRGEDVDRIPWSPCIDGYFLGGVDQVDGFRRIGADAMLRHIVNYLGTLPYYLTSTIPGKKMLWTKKQRTVDGVTEINYETPLGTLTEQFKYNPESPNIPWTTRRRVRTIEDVKILTWMYEVAEFVPMPYMFDLAEKRIGDDGISTISVPGTPMLTILNSEMDIDTFWYLYFDHTEAMEELFEAMHGMVKRICRACAEGKAPVIIEYENLSSTLVSPKIWEKYAPRWYREYYEILHPAGKILLSHACGHLFEFGEAIGSLALDGLVDVATPPTGSLPDLATARRLWGPEKFIMGGIDATAFASKEPADLKEYTREVLRNMGDGRRMALGSNDAVPKNTTWERLQAVTEVVREHGTFPLNRA